MAAKAICRPSPSSALINMSPRNPKRRTSIRSIIRRPAPSTDKESFSIRARGVKSLSDAFLRRQIRLRRQARLDRASRSEPASSPGRAFWRVFWMSGRSPARPGVWDWRFPRWRSGRGWSRRAAMSLAEPAAFAFPLILAGLAFAADVGSFHIALTGTKVANASFIGNMAPILTVIGGALFFAEHPPPRVWFALALALLGSWVMAGMGAPLKLGFGDIFALYAPRSPMPPTCLSSSACASGSMGRRRPCGPPPCRRLCSPSPPCCAARLLLPHSALGWTIVVSARRRFPRDGARPDFGGDRPVPVGLVALVLLAQPPFSALLAWRVIGETMTPAANGRRRRHFGGGLFGAPKMK